MIQMSRGLFLLYGFLFVSFLAALVFLGCSSKKDEPKQENASAPNSVSVEGKVEKTKPQALKVGNQPKRAVSEEIVKLLKSQKEAQNTLANNQQIKDSNQKQSNKLFLKSGSLTTSRGEIEKAFNKEVIEPCESDIVKRASKAMDNNDTQIRLEAIQSLFDINLTDSNVMPIVRRGLKDKDEQVREESVRVLSCIKDPQADLLLVQALEDTSEDVRRTVLETALEEEDNIRWDVFKAGMVSPYQDVKEDSVSTLIEISKHNTIDILILGLKDSNPEFRDQVSSAIDLLVSQEFSSYNEAKNWWDSNRNRYDENLCEKEE